VVKSAKKLHGLVPASFETYQIVEPGDIIVRPTDLQNDWVSLRFGLSRNRGIITSAYLCFLTKPGLTREYGHLLLHTYDLMKVFYGLGSGLRQNLDWNDFKYLPCPVPPLPEQQAIVRFLDYMDRRIRHYIRVKKQLTTLLNEQKQAIIQKAVTGGLDPNVRFKPSDVEWLGDVPEHWEILPLKYLGIKFGSGMTPRGGASVYQASGIPLIRSQNVHFDGLKLDDVVFISEDIHNQMSGTHVKPDDVLLNITGASIGRVTVAPENLGEANVNQHVSIIRPNKDKVIPQYLATFLSSPFIQGVIYRSANGAAREGLPLKDMKALPIIVPTLHEQTQIMVNLHKVIDNNNVAIQAAQHNTKLMQEFRTRLLADVVTGKLDVREAASLLPDEFEELEPSTEVDEVAEDDEPGEEADLDTALEEVDA
jgi:type I restriction enzyme S subunit